MEANLPKMIKTAAPIPMATIVTIDLLFFAPVFPLLIIFVKLKKYLLIINNFLRFSDRDMPFGACFNMVGFGKRALVDRDAEFVQ